MMRYYLARWFLTRGNTDAMIRRSFKKAAYACRGHLKQEGLNGLRKLNIRMFESKIPLSNKESIFNNSNSFRQLISNRFDLLGTIMLSSGTSGNFSIGVLSRKALKTAARDTDLFLQLFFGAKKGKTLVINASSMGVRIYSNHVVCDTGPRPDIVIGLLKTVAVNYEKVFIVGDPVFIKLMVEESIDAGLSWDHLNVWFISGGDWLPESLRDYVHEVTGKNVANPSRGYWSAVYGMTELGYPLFFETSDLIAYRSRCFKEQDFKQWTKHAPRCTTPFFFHYRPDNYYLEAISDGNSMPELVFTTLDKRRLFHLVRYATGDAGELLNRGDMPNLFYKLPVVRFWGRLNNYLQLKTCKVLVTDLKELLFADKNLAPNITGFFTLEKSGDKALMTVQLKIGRSINIDLFDNLSRRINQVYPDCILLGFVAYHEMRHQMELDFERKFNPLI